MKTLLFPKPRLPGRGLRPWAGLLLALGLAVPIWAQYEVPQLRPGYPNPTTPTNVAGWWTNANAWWNRTQAYTPGGGTLVISNRSANTIARTNVTVGYTVRNRIGTGIVPLSAQYGVGDVLDIPPEALDLVPEGGWVPLVGTEGNPSAVKWITFANTNLFVAVDEGVVSVRWTNAAASNEIVKTYVIGPNLTRRPVRLFWTEGQYTGPRVRFGNSYEVIIHYNNQILSPHNNPANATNIANEQIGAVLPATIFIKNNELRAMAGVSGRVLISYSRRPEGISTNRELLGFEVVDVLEPMSSTLAVHVGDRLFPKVKDNTNNALFCDITRGGVDSTGERPDDVFAYKHMMGARNGWVWAIRPTDAPWQLEIFWKAKEQLDVIWPFEVDIYDVTWDLESQRCALVNGNRGGPGGSAYYPPQVHAQVMPYQSMQLGGINGNSYAKSTAPIMVARDNKMTPLQPGMCTIKYTIGEDVFFETIRVVSELSDLVYQGVSPWTIGSEIRPFLGDGAATEGRYDEWPGMLRLPPAPPTGNAITNYPGDRWNRYHAGLFKYPTGYQDDPVGRQSQIFAVNLGHLSAWWWNPTALVEREQFPHPIYWPSLVCDYRNEWPAASPQLVIASFRGSSYGGYLNDGTGSLNLMVPPVAIQGTPVVTNDVDYGWGDPNYDRGFTFESWIKPVALEGYQGVMSMRAPDGTNALSLFVKDGLVGAAVLTYDGRTVVTQEWYSTSSVEAGDWAHVAISYEPEGVLRFYVEGQPSGFYTNLPANLGGSMGNSMGLGTIGSWTPSGAPDSFGPFVGSLDEIRMWEPARSPAEILADRLVPVDVNSNPGLVFRFDLHPSRYYSGQDPLDGRGYFYLTGLASGKVELDAAPSANVVLQQEGRTYNGQNAKIYTQNDANLAGYNPNEEHALLVGPIVFALRNDLNLCQTNASDTSQPYVLVEHRPDAEDWRQAIDVYQVVATNRHYPRFVQHIEAGRMIQPPAPLRAVLPDNCKRTYVEQNHEPYIFRDRLRYYWAKQAANNGGKLNIVMRFFYPMQVGFYIPQLGASQLKPLTEVPWLSAFEEGEQSDGTITNGTPVRLTFNIQWPEIVPSIKIGDTLTIPKYGLPAVRGQKSVRVVYQQSVAASGSASKTSVVLLDPTVARKVTLTNVPPKMRAMRDPRSGNTFFSDLDPDLRERLFFVPFANPATRLQLTGMFMERDNYHYLRLNLMTPDLIALAKDPKRVVGADVFWTNAIDALPTTRVERPDENEFFDTLALCTSGHGAGYVTLVFNNSTNIDMVDPGDPVGMKVIKVLPELHGGYIDILTSANPLDKYMTLRQTGDFAGQPQKWAFDWWYARPDPGTGMAPTNDADWRVLLPDAAGRYSTIFGSSGAFGLADTYVRCRYRALDAPIKSVVGTNYSDWTKEVLCEGWIKRVVKAINPFDQRIRDYMNYALNMDLSMIQQAGQPYAGDIPLNMDAINEYGLIPIYQTVLEQSRGLSIDSTLDVMPEELSVCLALMLAAGRLNDFYMVLGNEAYADALNPSISFGNNDPVLTGEAPSVFAFQNILPNLLEEELALLRGRDCAVPVNPSYEEFPIYNRLPWNFTADITHGQMAYVLNYGVSDLKGNQDGVVDSKDAAKLYPQGHGDAWGHYLSAAKSYYYLFRHQNFTWFPQLEGIRVGTIEVTMTALHEVKFAGAAAARARAGLAVMDRTYSKLYEEGNAEAWAAQRDTIPSRAWGVGEWGARVHMGAYCDWLLANALLPDKVDPDAKSPVGVIDRTTVPELTQIALAAEEAQQIVDTADRGMNPLGLGPGTVPFDISPADIDQGKTHFEQALAKAQEALKVAKGVFDRVQTVTAALRDQNEQRDLDTVVQQQEQAFDRQLIEIYGFPYQEDIGPGKLYPQGYIGPDLSHYSYISRYDYFGRIPLNAATLRSTVVRPTVIGSGTRSYDPGQFVTPVPSSDPDLAIEDILTFIDPQYAQKFSDIKSKYQNVIGNARMTRRTVDSLGIAELSSFYGEVFGAYDTLEGAVFGVAQDAIAWFDGVISAPVDKIDEFISNWVGPTATLAPVQLKGPNINFNTNELVFYIGSDGLPSKPDNYVSMRRAEGEIQVILSQYVLALREASAAIANSEDLYKKVQIADSEYRNTVGSQLNAYYASVDALDNMNSLQQIKEVVNKAIAMVDKVYGTAMEVYESIEAAVPKVAGMSFDIGAVVTGVARAGTAAANAASLIEKLANMEQITSTEKDLETSKRILELNQDAGGILKESTVLAMKVVDASLVYLQSLDKLDVALQKAETFRMQYQRAIASGDMIQVEREQARRIWASDLTGRRYRNMGYQIMRNDDLVRYEQTFAMARRYVYLAAKAYDYETGLLRHDGAVGAPGREFLSQIVRARALGRFGPDGTPLPGGATGDPGLADIMARMQANWSVLDGRLNFNNPQVETGTFSLRQELFRIPPGDAFNKTWREVLARYKVPDVRDVLEYRTHCLPFTPGGAAEPGLVIPFNTTIDFRQNFFGLPLAAGDNAYDSTHFATKVRGVGVWFSNYRSSMLANQPRVYLVPVGEDRMRVPDGVGETLRSWNILDQALPIPYPLSNETWMRADWNVRTDVLGGDFFARRRLPSMRAYHDSGFNMSEMTLNSRLIGRSVWNSRWLLIIPGGTLLADPARGLEQFIQGRELAPGSGTYDGAGVTDIKLYFLTYSYSGN